MNDAKTKSATERQLSIIGEAVNKLLKDNPPILISDAPKIISLRNRIIHSYDNLDDSIIYAVVRNHLNTL